METQDTILLIVLLTNIIAVIIVVRAFVVYKMSQKKYRCQEKLSNVHSNANFDVNDVTELNFIQGSLGNCGMISSMASLATNRDLLKKVVPVNQKFNKKTFFFPRKQSNFAFNLFKNGKPHKVVVNESLMFQGSSSFPFGWKKLYYSRSCNKNFIGPLLEKALVKLLFNGEYKFADNVRAVKVFSCFSNNFFEVIFESDLSNLGYKLQDVIIQGVKNSSLIMIAFKNDSNYHNLNSNHAYTLTDCTKDTLSLYDPHGKYLTIPLNVCTGICRLAILYTKNKIFNIPCVKVVNEFSDSFKELNMNYQISWVYYRLTVEEDDTEILINFIRNNYNDVLRHISIYQVLFKATFRKPKCFKIKISSVSSLRTRLKMGRYIIEFQQNTTEEDEVFFVQKYSTSSEKDKDNFHFRLAASKNCTVEKCSKQFSNELQTIL